MPEVERLCDRVIMMKRGRIEDDAARTRSWRATAATTLEDVFLDVARGRGPGGRRHERVRRASASAASRRTASAPWCCATGIC